MVAVKRQKRSSKPKLGGKRQVNKWVVLAGIATVAIVGAVIVRFSSASQWRVIAHDKTNIILTTKVWKNGSRAVINRDDVIRGCVRAYSTDRTKNATITIDVGGGGTTRTVTPQGGVYCTKSWRNKADSSGYGYLLSTDTNFIKDSGPNVWVVAVSVERLQ